MYIDKVSIEEFDQFIREYYMKNLPASFVDKYAKSFEHGYIRYPDKQCLHFKNIYFIAKDFAFYCSVDDHPASKEWREFMYGKFGEEYKEAYIEHMCNRPLKNDAKSKEEYVRNLERMF